MGISEKSRSLYAGMPGGGGFQFKTDPSGLLYLPPESIPFEFENIFVTWAHAQPQELQNELRHQHEGIDIGISCEAWERFIKWMLPVLENAIQNEF